MTPPVFKSQLRLDVISTKIVINDHIPNEIQANPRLLKVKVQRLTMNLAWRAEKLWIIVLLLSSIVLKS